jgi:hypothetical protein
MIFVKKTSNLLTYIYLCCALVLTSKMDSSVPETWMDLKVEEEESKAFLGRQLAIVQRVSLS